MKKFKKVIEWSLIVAILTVLTVTVTKMGLRGFICAVMIIALIIIGRGINDYNKPATYDEDDA